MSSPDIGGILDSAESTLQGEPARFIGYGAAIVIVAVSLASNALGFTRIPAIDLPTALVDSTAAIATVVGVIESIRHFVTPVASMPATEPSTDVPASDTGDTT